MAMVLSSVYIFVCRVCFVMPQLPRACGAQSIRHKESRWRFLNDLLSGAEQSFECRHATLSVLHIHMPDSCMTATIGFESLCNRSCLALHFYLSIPCKSTGDT